MTGVSAVIGAASAALAVAITLTIYKVVSRWLGKALRRTLADAITDTVQPQLTSAEARLTTALTNLQEQGTAEHRVVAERLTRVEEEVAALNERIAAVELRLPTQ